MNPHASDSFQLARQSREMRMFRDRMRSPDMAAASAAPTVPAHDEPRMTPVMEPPSFPFHEQPPVAPTGSVPQPSIFRDWKEEKPPSIAQSTVQFCGGWTTVASWMIVSTIVLFGVMKSLSSPICQRDGVFIDSTALGYAFACSLFIALVLLAYALVKAVQTAPT